MENWLRMMQQWGIPLPEAPTPPPVAPQTPFIPPDNSAASMMGLSGLPMPYMSEYPTEMPAAPPMEEPLEEPIPAPTGFAPFQPPAQIAQGPQDLFGFFNQTIGGRMPQQQQSATRTGPMLRAQPGPQMGAGMMGMGAPRKPPIPDVHPRLARDYPQAARAANMVNQARRRKGWI